MSEQPQIHPDDWQSVADQYMHWDENLRPHVEHQLQQHGLTPYEVADPALEHEVYNQLVVAAEDLNEQCEQPGRLNYDKVTKSLVEGDFEDWQMDGLVGELKHTADISRDVNREAGIYAAQEYGDTLGVLQAAPIELVRDIYAAESDSGEALREMIGTNLQTIFDRQTGIDLLTAIHGKTDVLALKSEPGPHQDDPLLQRLFQSGNANFAVMAAASIKRRHESLKAQDEQAADTYLRDKQAEYLRVALGFSDTMADEISFAALPRLHENDRTGKLDGRKTDDFFRKMNIRLYEVGKPTLERLHQELGVTNFDYYEPEHLKDIDGLLQNDPAVIERFQSGDTTVILSDVRGDHNGALATTGWQFNDPGQRSLMFEVTRPSDLYRRMSFLKQRGIKPSTLVLAAHGSPGRMWFGAKGEGVFNLSNNEADDKVDPAQSFNLAESKGIARLVEDYMQDGRGDVSEDTAGRRRLILKSCTADAPRPVRRAGEAFAEAEATEREESMAETLAQVAKSEKLDIFASQYPIYMNRTTEGVRISADINDVKTPVNANQLRLDSNGQVVRTEVEEIKLRRPPQVEPTPDGEIGVPV